VPEQQVGEACIGRRSFSLTRSTSTGIPTTCPCLPPAPGAEAWATGETAAAQARAQAVAAPRPTASVDSGRTWTVVAGRAADTGASSAALPQAPRAQPRASEAGGPAWAGAWCIAGQGKGVALGTRGKGRSSGLGARGRQAVGARGRAPGGTRGVPWCPMRPMPLRGAGGCQAGGEWEKGRGEGRRRLRWS